MKALDLIPNEVYTYTPDKKVPMRFTGRTKPYAEMNLDFILCEFVPIKTKENKNWVNITPIWLKFSEGFDNNLIIKN